MSFYSHARPGTRGCSRVTLRKTPVKFSELDVALAELELELIQSHMAQKPVLRGEVGCACVAREVSVERGGMGDGMSNLRRTC